MVGVFNSAAIPIVRRISVNPKDYGFKPGLPVPRPGPLASVPALLGLFRSGRLVVGISQVNAMATNVLRGSGG
jgi:hypothetical protein